MSRRRNRLSIIILLALALLLLFTAGYRGLTPARAAGGNAHAPCTVPVTPVVAAAVDSGELTLTWEPHPANVAYHVYRAEQPVFNETDTPFASLEENTFRDSPGTNAYYRVRAQGNCDDLTLWSNTIGLRAQTVNPAPGAYTFLALPFDGPFTSAADLAPALPGAAALLTWRADATGFLFYVPGGPGTDFPLTAGDVVLVQAGPTGLTLPDNTFTHAGDAGSVEFDLVPSADNFLSVPLQRSDLDAAAALATDIGDVTRLLQWDAGAQAFIDFYPPDDGTNFGLRVGDPVIATTGAAVAAAWPRERGMLGYADLAELNARQVMVQWLESDRANYGADFTVYRAVGEDPYEAIAITTFPDSADKLAERVDEATLNILAYDLRQDPAAPPLELAEIYTILAANPTTATLAAQQYPQLALGLGLAYNDANAPEGDLAYYAVARGSTAPNHYPICVPATPPDLTPAALAVSQVVPIPGDLGILGSTRPLNAAERYDWGASQSLRKVDGAVYLRWGTWANGGPAAPDPTDPYACVTSADQTVAGYRVYRYDPWLATWALANPTTPGGGSLLITPASVAQDPALSGEPYLFSEDLWGIYPAADPAEIYTDWQYRVCAVDRSGVERGCTAALTVPVRELDPPLAPVGIDVSADISHTQLTVSGVFSDVTETSLPLDLIIMRSQTSTLPLDQWDDVAQIALPAAAPTFTFAIQDAPPQGTRFWYRTQVRDDAGNWSPASPALPGTLYPRTPPPFPAIPHDPVDCSQNTLPLSLTGLDDRIVMISLYRAFDPAGPWQLIENFTVVDNAVTIDDDYRPTAGVNIYYRLDAKDAHGNVSASQPYCTNPGDPGLPLEPPVVTEEAGDDGQTNLNWPEGTVTITIYRDGEEPETVTVTGDSYTIETEPGETVEYEVSITNENGSGPATTGTIRDTRLDFLDTNRPVWDLGPIESAIRQPDGSVRLMVRSACDCDRAPLAAAFRRVPGGDWIQVTPVSRFADPTVDWYLDDTSDPAVTETYEYVVLAFSQLSYEVIGYWTSIVLPAATPPPPIPFTAPLEPVVSPNCAVTEIAPPAGDVIQLANGWTLDVTAYYLSNGGNCPPAALDYGDLSGIGVLQAPDGATYGQRFWNIAADPVTFTHLGGRLTTGVDITVTPTAGFTTTFSLLEFVPGQLNAQATVELAGTVRVADPLAPAVRSRQLAGVIAGVTPAWTWAPATVTGIHWVDENLPLTFQPASATLLADFISLDGDVPTVSRFSYTAASDLPDNNLGYLHGTFTGESLQIGVPGLFGTVYGFDVAYRTSLPGGIDVSADVVELTLAESRIFGGSLTNATASLTYITNLTVADSFRGGNYVPSPDYAPVPPLLAERMLDLTPPGVNFAVTAGGAVVGDVVLNQTAAWPGWEHTTLNGALFLAAGAVPDVSATGRPAPAENAWLQYPWTVGELDPGVNLNRAAETVLYSCYSPSDFAANTDLYVRRGGVSEQVELIVTGDPAANRRTNFNLYQESIVEFAPVFLDNAIYSGTLDGELYLPYPTDDALRILWDTFDDNNCASAGQITSADLWHQYWNVTEQTGGAGVVYVDKLDLPYAADLPSTMGGVLTLYGTSAEIHGLIPAAAGPGDFLTLRFTSEWLPTGDVGRLQTADPAGAVALRVSGLSFVLDAGDDDPDADGTQDPIAVIKLSRFFNATPFVTAAGLPPAGALPSIAGIDLANNAQTIPDRWLDTGGALTPQALAACAAVEAVGCGFVLLDGDGSVDYFGEARRLGVSTSAIGFETVVNALPIAVSNELSGSIQLVIDNPGLAWPLLNAAVDGIFTELEVPVMFMGNVFGGALVGVVHDASVVPVAPAEAYEILRSDLSLVATVDWDATRGYEDEIGLYFGYHAAQAAFRALALNRPTVTVLSYDEVTVMPFDLWEDVADDIVLWSERFGYAADDDIRDDADSVIDLAFELWETDWCQAWAEDECTAPVTDISELSTFLLPRLDALDGQEAYGDVGGVRLGAALDVTGAQLATAGGQATFVPDGDSFLDGLRLDTVTFGTALDVRDGDDSVLSADWVFFTYNRDGELIAQADNVMLDLIGEIRQRASLYIISVGNDVEERFEGMLEFTILEIDGVGFGRVGGAFGSGTYLPAGATEVEELIYVGIWAEVGWDLAGAFPTELSVSVLAGTVYNSAVLRAAGFEDLMDKFIDEPGLPTTLTGLYLQGSGNIPLFDYGCLLSAAAEGELRLWYFEDNFDNDAYGGQVEASIYGELLCLLSGRGNLALSLERVTPGLQSTTPPGYGGLQRTCPAGGDACFAFAGSFWVAGGIGFDCDPHTWDEWDERWWGDSWCWTFGAAIGLAYIDPHPAGQDAWIAEFRADYE